MNPLDLKPLSKMWERVEHDREDGFRAYFGGLMYAAEMVIKLTTAALVAAIDESQASRTSLTRELVNSDGIGDWPEVLWKALTGASSKHLLADARREKRELVDRVRAEAWQHKVVGFMRTCLSCVDPSVTARPPEVVRGIEGFRLIARLRNKTNGHGAPTTETLRKIVGPLEKGLRLFVDNHSLFRREWAYLYCDNTDRHRARKLVEGGSAFDSTDALAATRFREGVYVFLGRPVHVELIRSTLDLSDYFLPNGRSDGARFELLSYITGKTCFADVGELLGSGAPLPPVHAAGQGASAPGDDSASLPSDVSAEEVAEQPSAAPIQRPLTPPDAGRAKHSASTAPGSIQYFDIRETSTGRFHLNGFGISVGGQHRDSPFCIRILDRAGRVVLVSHPTTALELGIAARSRGDYDSDKFRQKDIVMRSQPGGRLVPGSAIGRRIRWR